MWLITLKHNRNTYKQNKNWLKDLAFQDITSNPEIIKSFLKTKEKQLKW